MLSVPRAPSLLRCLLTSSTPNGRPGAGSISPRWRSAGLA